MPERPEKSPKSAEEQDAPAPERPVTSQEAKRGGPMDKPSQAEGEREKVEEREAPGSAPSGE